MTETAIFTVTGMKCGGCETNVIEKLTALDGVIKVIADCKANHVSVEFEAEKIDIEDLEDEITAAGFGLE